MSQVDKKTTSRNPIFPEGTFLSGDYPKIAKMAGVSRSLVVATLVYRSRHNKDVVKAAKEVAEFNKKYFKN